MKNLFLLLTALIMSAIICATAVAQPQFYHLGKNTELAQTTVNGLYQDENGLLWIGTRHGIKKYDGVRIENVHLQGLSGGVSSAHHPSVCGNNGFVFFNTDYRIIEYDLELDCYRTIFTQDDTSVPPLLSFFHGPQQLWIGMKNTLFSYSNGELHSFAQLSEGSAEISAICEAAHGALFIATKEHGLFTLSPGKSETRKAISGSEIICLFEDSCQRIWVGTLNDGLYRISPDGELQHYRNRPGDSRSLVNDYVRSIGEDTGGHVWVGTMQGVSRLDPITDKFSSYGLAERGQSGLSNLSVWVILKDRMGTMWFGTYYGGVNYCNPEANLFSFVDIGTPGGSGYPIVSRIAEDKRNHLWIGTEGNGLVRYDPASQKIYYYTQGSGSLSHNNIKTLHYENRSDQLWIGTHLGGLDRYDPESKRFYHYTIDKEDHSKNSEIVHGLASVDSCLYIGTLSNLYRMRTEKGEIEKVAAVEDYFFEIRDLITDRDGNIWLAGNRLCRYDPLRDEILVLDDQLRSATGSRQLFTTCLMETATGDIIIGTSGEGILRYIPGTDSIEVYNSRNGRLLNDYVTCLGESREGWIIAGSGAGFSCIDLRRQAVYRFNSHNGFPLLSMLPGCVFRSRSGQVILGGLNGFAFFDPRILLHRELPVRLFFSQLSVNNREITPGDETGILGRALWATEELRLRSNQNNLSVGIGNDNFIGSVQPLYQYRLEGFDHDWVDFLPSEPIRYMNLPYGRYQLKVRAVVFRNFEESRQIAIGIRIRPPLYLSWYAYVVYVLLAVGIVYFFRSRLLLRTSLEFERREKLRQEEINDTKQRFFANMSHELRTPLTLISGQLELLLMTGGIPANIHRSLSQVHVSAQRMNRLITELLDFLKYSRGKFRLKVGKYDLVGVVNEIYQSFYALAELKGIDLTFRPGTERIEIWFDPTQMRKVFHNLLSNAFKYTESGGAISMEIVRNKETVRVMIRDTGIGIPGSLKEKIFERFYQVDNTSNSDWYSTGTGIGLSLTRNILEAHHGSVHAESELGEGSVFVVTLRPDEDLFSDDDSVDFITESSDGCQAAHHTMQEEQAFLEELYEEHKEYQSGEVSILIVEDDGRLRKMLVEIFEPLFRVFEATDGETGYEIARSESPDLVISDVMMPGISGSELCRRLKSDFDTCHIPVLLLTALGGVDHRIEGFHSGADDYVAKPFSVKLLVSRCLALLNNRRLLQRKFSSGTEESVQAVTTNPLDQKFLDDAVRTVEDNIEHGCIDVGLLASRLAMSRTKLYLKMKGVTGLSPHEFIQNIKLKVAARLLRDKPEMNISEISFYLGFNSLNYFGKYFRGYFGQSPSAYRKSHTAPGAEENSGDPTP